LTGLHLVLRWTRGRSRSSLRNAVWAGIGLLAVTSVWFNVGLAVMSGRLLDGSTPPRDIAAFVGFQYAVHDNVPGGARPFLSTGAQVPAPKAGRVFVLGDCEGLYWSDGSVWTQLEGGELTGRYRLKLRFPSTPTEWEPLVVSRANGHSRGDKPQYLTVRVLPGHRVQFAFDGVFAGTPIAIDPGSSHELNIVMDAGSKSRTAGEISVRLDGRAAYSMTIPNGLVPEPLRPLVNVSVGRADLPGLLHRFTGSIIRLPPKTSLCEELTH
ncbi:MAG: hypothetical protein ABJC79_08780, partial [Acidimicrobiia bacterium]